MRKFFIFLLIILLVIILSNEKENKNKTKEKSINKKDEKNNEKKIRNSENEIKSKPDNKTSNKTKKSKKSKKKKEKKDKKDKKEKERKLVPPPMLTNIADIPDDVYNLPNDNVYILNDKNFDRVLQNGNNYRWLVILFSETCGHCYFARTEIRKVLPEYKYSSYLRFAEIEINFNPMTNMRFNIEGVPYIFMLQNNTMYIMDLYPNEKNLIKFIGTDLALFLSEEKKPFPPAISINRSFLEKVELSLQDITNNFNEFLNSFGIKYEFTPLLLIISLIMLLVFICFFEYFCCIKFCPEEEELKEEEKYKTKEENKKEKEKEIDGKTEEKKIINELKEDKENKEISEEEKIKREKEKENKKKENKEKENKRKNEEDKKNKDNKTNSKKKKKKE